MSVDPARIRGLFVAALEVERGALPAFFAREGVGDTTRAEVERLLAHDRRASVSGFLAAGPPAPAVVSLGVGQQVDGYRVVELLGEGGMGEVYLVDQSEPFERRLALKLIRLGMNSAKVLARFETERRALARMDHPGIARVFDAGTTERGQPYFVMEYVDGAPITEHCEQRALEIEARLRLMLRVCDAVQHAHQKGIIHRDLKPSNILVAGEDPKVIDFGLARATDRASLPDSQLTEHGQILGTPEYMSPEQVDGRELDIDTRSDIYALGAVLYELITGERPFPGLRDAGDDEMRRRIREEAPPRPSTRAGGARLHGDLDWITMQALEKDRARRYQTAGELAADLRHHLSGRPIVARPPSGLYLARKFVRRHRTAVAAAAAVIVASIVGVIGLTTGLVEARNARAAAQRSLDRFNLLAHGVRLKRATNEAAVLYPASPENAGRLRRWLTDLADPLLAESAAIDQALVDVRRRARSGPPYRFAAEMDQVLHDALAKLVDDLRSFDSVVESVRERLQWAQRVRHDSIEVPAAAWTAAAAAVRRDPRFDDLVLSPQLGLVPLGADPSSGLQEFAHLRSGSAPRRDPATGVLQVEDDCGLVFVLLPGGTFAMGAQRGADARNRDPAADPREAPVVEITLAPFLCAKYEMTQAQWMRLSRGANPSRYRPGTAYKPGDSGGVVTLRHPVEDVSWTACDELLRRHGLALPTEAQWEFACRAGRQSPWWTGDDRSSLTGAANLRFGVQDGHALHAPVDGFRPNPFGLHHVHGNVREWCADGFDGYALPARAGDGLREGAATDYRVVRGGSFTGRPEHARSACRGFDDPDRRDGKTGVRPTRALR